MAVQQGIDAVTAFLDGSGVGYEVLEHEQTFSAREDARAAGVSPDDEAKGVLLRVGDGYCLAVIPASRQLDLRKVREILGGAARLATEREMAADYDQFDVGALPPFGPMLSAREIVDRRLLDQALGHIERQLELVRRRRAELDGLESELAGKRRRVRDRLRELSRS